MLAKNQTRKGVGRGGGGFEVITTKLSATTMSEIRKRVT